MSIKLHSMHNLTNHSQTTWFDPYTYLTSLGSNLCQRFFYLPAQNIVERTRNLNTQGTRIQNHAFHFFFQFVS